MCFSSLACMQLLVQAKPAAQERPHWFSEPSKLFLPLFFQKFKSLLLVQAPHGPHGFPHHPSRHHGSYLVVHILHSSELVQFQAVFSRESSSNARWSPLFGGGQGQGHQGRNFMAQETRKGLNRYQSTVARGKDGKVSAEYLSHFEPMCIR